jgi:hypothetical protein
MAIESSLTKKDKELLKIENFIFHIIIASKQDTDVDIKANNTSTIETKTTISKKNLETIDEVRLTDSQRAFFRDRIIDASQGTQYIFKNTEKANNIKNYCNFIIDEPDKNG